MRLTTLIHRLTSPKNHRTTRRPARSAAKPELDALEGRLLLSTAPLPTISDITRTAHVGHLTEPRASVDAQINTAMVAPPIVGSMLPSSVAMTAPSSITHAVTTARTILSVASESDRTPNPVNFQYRWSDTAAWQSYTLQPSSAVLESALGRGRCLSIRFDWSFAAGFQERIYQLVTKPFVAGGLEGWTPKYANDGMPFYFQLNSSKSGLDLIGNYALDTTRYPSLRSQVMSSFPTLKANPSKFEVLGSATPSQFVSTNTYNCIAWSVGVVSNWVWPGAGRVSDFDVLYGRYGFRRISTLDYSLQRGVQKIVLYADSKGNCTHGSWQNIDGTWTSKLGSGPLIRHAGPDVFGNGANDYGHPIAVYVRSTYV